MDIFLKIVKKVMAKICLTYTIETGGALGPEEIDIRSSVPLSILIWGTKFFNMDNI